MNSEHQDIVSFLEDIHAARHLIADAYCNSSIDITDTNQRLLRKLQQIRAMRPNVNRDDSLRLTSVLTQLLDQAVHRVRSLAISSNFGEQMARLLALTDGYGIAVDSGNEDDQDMYLSDFDVAAYEISEEVGDTLLRVSTLAHTNFANAGSYAQKIRQNTHYLEQMNTLVDTLENLQEHALVVLLEETFYLRPMHQLYSRHILQNMSTWRSMLLDIISHLERYLNKLRRVEPNARRIRLFSMFLQRNPDYSPRDPVEYQISPEWAYRHPGLKVAGYPDIEDEEHQLAYAEVARSIEGAKSIELIEREEGMLLEDEEPLVVEIKPSPFEEMVYAYLQQARSTPDGLSAMSFFEKSDMLDGASLEVSLMCFASLLANTKKLQEVGANDVLIERIDCEITSDYVGNIIIEDFIACPKP